MPKVIVKLVNGEEKSCEVLAFNVRLPSFYMHVERGDDTLVVATSQPQEPDIWLEVRKTTFMKVELVVAYEGYIDAAINYFFPPKNNLDVSISLAYQPIFRRVNLFTGE